MIEVGFWLPTHKTDKHTWVGSQVSNILSDGDDGFVLEIATALLVESVAEPHTTDLPSYRSRLRRSEDCAYRRDNFRLRDL